MKSFQKTFFVPGIPRPGGSKTPFRNPKTGKPIVVDASRKNKEWRSVVALTAFEAMKGKEPTRLPVILRVIFYMPRPKSHYRTGKHAGELKEDAPIFHTNTPDATKLMRSTEDALTGILWHDDAQVVAQMAVKKYGESPGARIIFCVINEI